MPPRKPKNWPPRAVLTLVDQTSRTVTVSTVGTIPGKVGPNKRTAADSTLASWVLFWGDGTQQGGSGQPPTELPHTYPSTLDQAVIRLVVTDVNTLTASATLTVSGLTGAPDPPTDLVATPLSDIAIRLDWQDLSLSAQTFTIEFRTGGAPFAVLVAGLPATTLTYTDSSLTPATAYDYRVQAVNASGVSEYSNIASATTFPATPPVTPPAAPSGLSAVAISSAQINLAWTDNASDESGFFVERQINGGSFSVIATVAANTVAYSDLTVQPSTIYGYRVRAFNAAGNSAYSNTATATTPAAPVTPPAAPSALTTTPLTPTSVALAWTDNASNEANFQLERRPAGGAFTLLITLAANLTTFTDATVSPATTYDYRIRAINTGGTSAYSNTATVTTPAIPPPDPPIARLTSAVTSLTLGQPLTLSTAGTLAGGSPLASWQLNWNDGVIQNGPISTLPAAPTHVYALVGTYTPVLRVTDTAGNFDTDSPLPITVNPAPPSPPDLLGYRPQVPPIMGMQSKGCRGPGGGLVPVIIRVNTRTDSGAGLTLVGGTGTASDPFVYTGNLRAALTHNTPRAIVFDVSGYITINSNIQITSPYFTVMGQTAPSPGVCIRTSGSFNTEASIIVATTNSVWQHIRIRPGDNMCNSGMHIWNLDQPIFVHTHFIDHCSFSWHQDEGIGVTYHMSNVALWRSIISEGLSGVGAGCTGGGADDGHCIAWGWGTGMAVLQSILALTNYRMPQMEQVQGALQNNIYYGIRLGPWINVANTGEGTLRLRIDGNYFKRDANFWPSSVTGIRASNVPVGGQLYLNDNIFENGPQPGNWVPYVQNGSVDPRVSSPPTGSTVTGYTTLTAAQAYTNALSVAGCRPKFRNGVDSDGVDQRIITNIINRTGAFPCTSVASVGGYPTLANNTVPFVVPANPFVVAAGDPIGRTNLEVYAEGLAQALEP